MRALLLGVVFVSVGCGDNALVIDEAGLDETATTEKAVIYGTDNRTDVYAHPDATMRQRALQSTVALIPASALDVRTPSNVRVRSATLAQSQGLCAGQRFANDPTAAFCSGTLVDDDLVLTAGHCLVTAADCTSTRFVFRYAKASADALEPITTDDVFSCAGIVVRAETQTAQGVIDFALVRLTRPATPRFTPAPVRRSTAALVTGQRVGVIGSGSGVPFKIDTGGSVRDPGAGLSFEATTDTFGGNSGSGVYELDGYSVAGILVQGDTDYVRQGSCNVVNVCRESGCSGETIVATHVALSALCRADPSSRLCASAPRPMTPPPPAPAALAYQGRLTANATRNTADQVVTLRRGQTLSAGTCGVPGAVGTGDTFVRVVSSATRRTVAQNDDGCGRLSFLRFVAPADGDYVLRAGCYADTACTGTLAWEVR
ncbi:MAG: serine protease [Myxococcaceae bacterium]|nr:serine protease [Myxococcaceae bacterium]